MTLANESETCTTKNAATKVAILLVRERLVTPLSKYCLFEPRKDQIKRPPAQKKKTGLQKISNHVSPSFLLRASKNFPSISSAQAFRISTVPCVGQCGTGVPTDGRYHT